MKTTVTIGKVAAVTVATVLGATAAAAAQARPAADTTRPVIVFNDVFGGPGSPPGYVVLAAGTAYRIEVEPSNASVSIRQYRRPGQPVIALAPVYPSGTGGASYIVVPAETGEYQMDVTALGGEPVRVRIFRDPREQALLEGRARSAWQSLSFGARYMVLPGDLRLPTDTVSGTNGWQLCLGVIPGVLPALRRLGGCAFTYSRFDLPGGGTLTLAGLAPRFLIGGTGTVAVAVAADINIAGKLTHAGSARVTYEMFVVGLNLRWRIPHEPLELELEPGLAVVNRDSYTARASVGPPIEVPSQSQMLPRLAAGVHVRF